MFENLSERLGGVFDRLTKAGALSAEDVTAALREVRVALLEADVSLPVARDFIKRVQGKATGAAVTKSVTPGQQVVKIVHDELVGVLGTEAEPISLAAAAPVPILMVGLQGSGKTTTTGKLAKRLKDKQNKRVLMASLDTRRPAAMEQLRTLGEQIGVDTLPIMTGQTPLEITDRALKQARTGGYDVVMLDTAGRTHIDEELMAETVSIKEIAKPHEILLVVDALTGQDAINVARSFDGRLDVTGIVMTRVDGDGRGGAALSMRAATGKPIKLIGVGEKMDALEDFHPSRIADRILGMGDIVSLVEKAAETIDAAKAEQMAAKLRKGQFDLDDLADQLRQMSRMGGMKGLLGMMPGVGKAQMQAAQAHMGDGTIKRQVAIISSMTKDERKDPKVLNASRKKRIAKGSGTEVQEINRLLKMHRQMADMMKKMGKGGAMKAAMKQMLGKGGMPDPAKMDPAQMADLARGVQQGMRLPGIGGAMPRGLSLPQGLSGLGPGKKK